MPRRLWWPIGIAAVLLVVWIHPGFFFNPLTFHKDDVTYLPWSWYKSPLRLEYVDQSPPRNRARVVDDQAEVRHVMAELKKGLNAAPDDGAQTGEPYVVAIRLAPDGYDVLLVHGTIGSNFARLSNGKGNVPVLLTGDLRHLVEQRVAEAASAGN
ncbi:MAG: hypothetical protein ACM31P_05120 [Actinomycetota bacterium]